MDKGLERVYLWGIFYIVLSVIILLAFFNYIDNQADSGIVIKHYLSRDSSLLVDTLDISRGNISVVYTFDNPINVKVQEGEVVITDLKKGTTSKFFYDKKNNINFEGDVSFCSLNFNKDNSLEIRKEGCV